MQTRLKNVCSNQQAEEEKKDLHRFKKYSSHETYQYRVKNSNFTAEKPHRHQLTNVNITGNKTSQYAESFAMMYNIIFVVVLIKMHNLTPTVTKHRDPN